MTYYFIEDSSSKVVSYYTKAIRRTLELGGREGGITLSCITHLLTDSGMYTMYLRMELLMEVCGLLLSLNDVQHFPDKKESIHSSS